MKTRIILRAHVAQRCESYVFLRIKMTIRTAPIRKTAVSSSRKRHFFKKTLFRIDENDNLEKAVSSLRKRHFFLKEPFRLDENAKQSPET